MYSELWSAGAENAAVSLAGLKKLFSSCGDFTLQPMDFGLTGRLEVWVCWLDGTVDAAELSRSVLRPLTDCLRAGEVFSEQGCLERIRQGMVYRCGVRQRDKLGELAEDLCRGCCALIFPETAAALCFELRSPQTRAVSEPSLEKSLKGAKDSFVESLPVNTALVRSRIGGAELKLEEFRLGSLTRTRVALLYVEGQASEAVLAELRRRLETLETETLLSTGPLERGLTDCPGSPFPQLLHTERPDRFAMQLCRGRAGLLADGLPIGLLLPAELSEFMRVTGDDSMHPLVATGLTALRYLALLLSALLPALYTAMAMFHQEMIPTRLLLSVIEAERNVPFSTALEMLSMILAFSLLQEAGLRLPNPIGDTVSIIGALIVGQAAVEARLVSPIAIIVVAVSGIACYTLPSQDLAFAMRLCRLALLLGAILGGLYGVGLVGLLIQLHLADLNSCGRSYTAPLSDGYPFGLLRQLLRLPEPLKRKGGRDP